MISSAVLQSFSDVTENKYLTVNPSRNSNLSKNNFSFMGKVTNISKTIEDLKKEGLWFVCADMDGETMYNLNLKGPIGVVIGSEGEGVSRLVKEKCDFIASIPMKGQIDSLNASVAAGILCFEIVRQRMA